MGGFFLCRADPDTGRMRRAEDAMARSFRAQGMEPADRVTWQGHVLQTYRKRGQSFGGEILTTRGQEDGFLAACGTPIVDGRSGVAALEALAKRASIDPRTPGLSGGFAIIVGGPDGLRLFCDPLGLQQVFRDEAGAAWSSSFLAVAAAAPARRFKPQGVFEYVFAEMPHGGDTVVEEVRLHDCRWIARLDAGPPIVSASPPSEVPPSVESVTENCVAELRNSFASIGEAFEGRIDSGLSGGYDSRLILAGLVAVGARPRLHVYGSGASEDVQIAKELAAAAGLDIHHLDKTQAPCPSAAEYRARAVEWLLAFDGYSPDGVMGNGRDIDSRQQRAAGGAVPLNGGGGEIFRNFFYLPDGSYSRRQLLWTFYSQFDPAVMRRPYVPEAYYRALEAKLADVLGHDESRLSRREIEWLYGAFRCRFWMARNNSLNNRLGAYLTPLLTEPLARMALHLPMREKNHGRFEAALIRRLAPQLARVRSSYGHDFATPPPLRRVVADSLTLARPPWARRWSFTLKSRLAGRMPPPQWYAPARESISGELPLMRQFFEVGGVRHPGQLNRLYTLELLGQELGLA